MKLRYRLHRRFFAKPLVVLQIAETVPYNEDPIYGAGGVYERYRDATAEDLMNVEGSDDRA